MITPASINENQFRGSCPIDVFALTADGEKVSPGMKLLDDNDGLLFLDKNKLCFNHEPDFEKHGGSWKISVSSTSDEGQTITQDLTLRINNVNDPPRDIQVFHKL